MTPTEAMEIWTRNQHTKTIDRDIDSAFVLAREYMAEHDPRQLTLPLCVEVLGEPDKNGGWMIYGTSLVWSSRHHCIVSSSGLFAHTIGQLRRLVGVLRDELFPGVKPEDVREGGWYIVTMPGHPIAVREPWTKDGVTMFGSYPASECKIHGRVPMPE